MPRGVRTVTAQGGTAALTPRDVQALELVGRFRLMTAEQIKSVIFPNADLKRRRSIGR
jgi:hypothetical protein